MSPRPTRSPAPPSPLGPGFRAHSPSRTPSPASAPRTEPIKVGPASPIKGSVSEGAVPVLHHPKPSLHPSARAPLPPAAVADDGGNVRDSSASGFDFMEAMLAPYERDDNLADVEELSDESTEETTEAIITPVTPRTRPQPRVGERRDKVPERVAAEGERIKSLEGQVEGDLDAEVISFDRPRPRDHVDGTLRQGAKRKTVIDFPSPGLRPEDSVSQVGSIKSVSQSQPPPRGQSYAHPTHRSIPRIVVPSDTAGPNPFGTPTNPFSTPSTPRQPAPIYRPATGSPSRGGAYTIPQLPSTGTPVSPHLAVPPQSPFTPPRSPFAGPQKNRSSGSSESIAGYDLLKEKAALFRGGEDVEVVSPISPRKGRQESGPRQGVRPRNGVPSTMDFWKRFSVSVNKMDEISKGQQGVTSDSEWLSEAQAKRNRIKCMAVTLVVLLVLIGGGVAAAVILTKSGKEINPPSSPSLCRRDPAGGGAEAGESGAGGC